MSEDLAGRVGLVTGGGNNIGRQVALTLAGRGADVAVHVGSDKAAGERVAKEIATLGRRAVVIAADISRREEVDSMVAQATRELGPIDILVNSAAIRPHKAFVELTEDDWRKVLGVNLDGPFFLCRAVVPSMIERKRGSIVNIGGTASFDGGVRDAHIVVSKAGLHGLTKALAVELGGAGIRVNSVIFGTVETVRKLPASGGPDLSRIPMGRLATMQEAADAIAYLASDQASYITGQAIHVNGGFLLA
jgi:3-oxoacyl-[acyl-carrier protein] reductase